MAPVYIFLLVSLGQAFAAEPATIDIYSPGVALKKFSTVEHAESSHRFAQLPSPAERDAYFAKVPGLPDAIVDLDVAERDELFMGAYRTDQFTLEYLQSRFPTVRLQLLKQLRARLTE